MTTRSRSTQTGSATSSHELEWDELTTALNRWGIVHVAPGMPWHSAVPSSASSLLARLIRSNDARLHQATVLLLLTHPRLAGDLRSAIERLSGAERDRAMRRYVAAAAMQRMAWTRISMHLGTGPLIEPAYLDELRLPALDVEFGRMTLLALAEGERERYGYDAWGTYRALLDLFLNEIRRSDWGARCEDGPTEIR